MQTVKDTVGWGQVKVAKGGKRREMVEAKVIVSTHKVSNGKLSV